MRARFPCATRALKRAAAHCRTIETDGLDETPDLPVDEEANATPSEFDGKVVQSTDFNWCCNLNERERIVGSAYWAGKEG